MSRQALVTIAACCSATDGWSGLHRLQGRNPARSASARVEWNRTFSGRATRAEHDGRQ
jgi:hypothetical protein